VVTKIVYYITIDTSCTMNLDLELLMVKVSVGDVHQTAEDRKKEEERYFWHIGRYMIQMAHGAYCCNHIIIN